MEELERRPNLPEPAPVWLATLMGWLSAFAWCIAIFWLASIG